jgi:hypothetical protein
MQASLLNLLKAAAYADTKRPNKYLSRFFKGAAAYPLLAEALGDRGAAQSLASGSNKKRASAS